MKDDVDKLSDRPDVDSRNYLKKIDDRSCWTYVFAWRFGRRWWVIEYSIATGIADYFAWDTTD